MHTDQKYGYGRAEQRHLSGGTDNAGKPANMKQCKIKNQIHRANPFVFYSFPNYALKSQKDHMP
jgi:hypothetical protein